MALELEAKRFQEIADFKQETFAFVRSKKNDTFRNRAMRVI